MNKIKKYVLLIILVLFTFTLNCNISFAKYEIEAQITVASVQIDRTKPKLQIEYSNKNITNENVEVTIISNEEIKEKEGWTLNKTKKILTKTYEKNISENVEIEDLSGNISIAEIKINNIDKEFPNISIQKIENSNISYPQYANSEAKILIYLKIQDINKIKNKINSSNINISINNNKIESMTKEIKYTEEKENEQTLVLTLSNIKEEGKLGISINKEAVEDEVGNKNTEEVFDTKIIIDNTKPEASYSQKQIEQGKVNAIVTANESIQSLEGWNIEKEKVLNKIFTNNISYEITIKDLAGNQSKVKIDVTGATYIILTYASHNSAIGWSYGYGNYDIAGENAIKEDPIFKTESLAFNISGNIDKDFIQARAFVYTHWGIGAKSKCVNSGKIYFHGMNPSNSTWKTMLSESTIKLNNKEYMQFGGAGINGAGVTDINGNGELSMEQAFKFSYGISSIELKLKSYDYYSIIYQIYVNEVGWIKPAKNEEKTCYKEDKPMSAIRVALVPKTEEKAVIELWNKDTGKKISK